MQLRVNVWPRTYSPTGGFRHFLMGEHENMVLHQTNSSRPKIGGWLEKINIVLYMTFCMLSDKNIPSKKNTSHHINITAQSRPWSHIRSTRLEGRVILLAKTFFFSCNSDSTGGFDGGTWRELVIFPWEDSLCDVKDAPTRRSKWTKPTTYFPNRFLCLVYFTINCFLTGNIFPKCTNSPHPLAYIDS